VKIPVLSVVTLLIAFPIAAQMTEATHKITVTFDYDFTRTPACDAEAKKDCVQQFNVYDISDGLKNRTKLMVIAVPPGAHGVMKGISGTTSPLVFEPGKHLLSVAAQTPKGVESDLGLCKVWVSIPQ
jgi:hypothetical protein